MKAAVRPASVVALVMALSRLTMVFQGTVLPSLPQPRSLTSLPSRAKRIRPRDTNDGTMPSAVASAINGQIKNDSPAGAKALLDGTWKTNFYYGNIKDGMVGLAPYGPKVTAKTKAAIAKKKQALINGSFYEFTGPLYDQKGKLRVPKGKRLTVKDLYAMNWLVKGVIGSAKG